MRRNNKVAAQPSNNAVESDSNSSVLVPQQPEKLEQSSSNMDLPSKDVSPGVSYEEPSDPQWWQDYVYRGRKFETEKEPTCQLSPQQQDDIKKWQLQTLGELSRSNSSHDIPKQAEIRTPRAQSPNLAMILDNENQADTELSGQLSGLLSEHKLAKQTEVKMARVQSAHSGIVLDNENQADIELPQEEVEVNIGDEINTANNHHTNNPLQSNNSIIAASHSASSAMFFSPTCQGDAVAQTSSSESPQHNTPAEDVKSSPYDFVIDDIAQVNVKKNNPNEPKAKEGCSCLVM